MSVPVFQERNLGCVASTEKHGTCIVCYATLNGGDDTHEAVDRMYERRIGNVTSICPKCMVRLHKYLGDQLLDYYGTSDD